MQKLQYNKSKWRELEVKPKNTLQAFITNSCNLRCKGCFYAAGLGNGRMSLEQYRELVARHSQVVSKVILLGGEPFLHPELEKFLDVNSEHGLKTTIYTNGRALHRFNHVYRKDVNVRIGVYGATCSEKPLSLVQCEPDPPLTIVYMLRRDNLHQLYDAAKLAEERFNCKCFYVSSIRDIAATGDYWDDTPDTISPDEFADIAQEFVSRYDGNIPRIDIATRGVLFTEMQKSTSVGNCRFGNVFPDGSFIRCPFDIALNKKCSKLTFGEAKCNKHCECILQKISLTRVKSEI